MIFVNSEVNPQNNATDYLPGFKKRQIVKRLEYSSWRTKCMERNVQLIWKGSARKRCRVIRHYYLTQHWDLSFQKSFEILL